MNTASMAALTAEELEQHRPLLRRFLRRHWKDPHGIEDLVQETLLRACRRLHDLRDPTALEGWLLRIAYNIAMDWHRRGARREEAPAGQEPVSVVELSGAIEPPAEYRRETAEGRRQWSHGVRRALGKLTSRDRAFVVAHYFVGLSCRQISARSGLTVANVKVRLHRARRSMRRHLPSEDEFRRWLAHRSLYSADSSAGRRPARRGRPGAEAC